jgi:hypothetical protein
MAIKHQIRMQMAQYEVKKAEAEAQAAEEEFPGQPSLAVPSAVPATEISANAVSGHIRQL